MAIDVRGNYLSVGDEVVLSEPKVPFAKYRRLTIGIVTKITPCYVFVEVATPDGGYRQVPQKGDQLMCLGPSDRIVFVKRPKSSTNS